jgi:hypothetical protein
MNKRKRKSKLAPFVPVTKTTMATPAWRAMSLGARLLYIELRGRLRNDCLNNGKVFLSCRLAAKAIGVRPGSIARWYMENEYFGFLRKTGEGFLGVDGRGIAARYRFTEFRCEDQPSTRDFEKWNGKPFVFTPRRPSRKKQNPVTPNVTPRVAKRHIRRGSDGRAVCVAKRHIDFAARCVAKRHTSRSANRESPNLDQGSLTARALAQAGDAGSSPAPVAKPDLVTMVLEIVDAQLGTAANPLHPWNWPGRPDGIRLHSGCEAAWMEKGTPKSKEPYDEPATMPAPERPSAPDTPVPVPERTSNGGAPPSLPPTVGKPVLSSRDIQQEKEWVLDQERWVYSRADIAAGKLDEALRARLRKKVPPELVEIEFKRVMGVIAAK